MLPIVSRYSARDGRAPIQYSQHSHLDCRPGCLITPRPCCLIQQVGRCRWWNWLLNPVWLHAYLPPSTALHPHAVGVILEGFITASRGRLTQFLHLSMHTTMASANDVLADKQSRRYMQWICPPFHSCHSSRESRVEGSTNARPILASSALRHDAEGRNYWTRTCND